MLVRISFQALLLASVLAAQAHAEEPWDVHVQGPPGVRYQSASPAENRQAFEQARERLSPDYKGSEHLVGGVLICGPFLWKKIQTLPALSGGKGIPSHFRIPVPGGQLSASGRTFQDAASGQVVETEIHQELAKDGPFKLRKLSSEELQLLWAIFPLDLAEPLFLAESPHHRFVLIYVKGKLFQVDDFYQASLRAFEADSASPDQPALAFVNAANYWSQVQPAEDSSEPVSEEGFVLLSDQTTLSKNLTADELANYVRAAQDIIQLFAAQLPPRPGLDLSVQFELRSSGLHFVTPQVVPPLIPSQQNKLISRLMGLPAPKLRAAGPILFQIFGHLWGGQPTLR